MKRLLFLALAALCAQSAINAQVTVTYPQRTANYYGSFTTGTAGSFDQGSYQLGMYANGSGTKQAVRWRKFRTDGGGSPTSDRAMQVGDVFTVTLSGKRANGKIGFALLSSPSSVSSWADRESNYALSINLDGPVYNSGSWGAWYAKYSGGTSTGSTLIYGQQSYVDYTFTVTLLAPDRANITISNGSATSYLFDVALNNSDPITDYSIFLEDDWDGSSNGNIYWGLGAIGTQHSLSNGGNAPFGSSNGTFTVGTVIADGLVSNSSSSASVNTLVKNGTGTMTLTGASTYTGTTTINGGSLVLARSAGSTIPSTNDVVVNSGGNLKISSNQTIRNLSVASGGTVTVDAGVTLTISGTATINASGAFNGTGTVSMSGTSTMQINSGGWPGNTNAFTWSSSATLKFPSSGSSYGVNSTDTYWTSSNNPGNIEVGTAGVTLNAARTTLSAVTLNGQLSLAGYSLNLSGGSSLTLNSGASVTGTGQVLYNNTCNLYYAQGGPVTPGQEWAGNITGTTVTIKNNTALSFGASTVARTMGGSLNINSGSSLTLSSAAGGDLSLYGNITNAGTFNTNGRTLTFLTNNVSTYSKTGGGTDNIDNLVLNTQAGKSLSIDANTTLNIVSSLVLTKGNINLWGGSSNPTVLSIGAGASISGTGGNVIVGNNSYNSVKFAGASSITTSSALTISGATLSLPNSASAVTLNSTLSHNGPLALTAGSFTLGSSAALSLAGSITRGSGVLNAAAGTLTLNSSSAQSIPAGTFSGSIANLVVDNSNGITLSQAVTVTGTLTLTTGKLDVNAYDLTAGAVSGGSSTSYVKTSGTGSFILKAVPSSATIPVGNSTYNPVRIVPGSGTYDWGVRIVDAVTADPGFSNSGAVSRQWDVTPYSSGVAQATIPGAATISFYYAGQNIDAPATFSNASSNYLWHYYLGAWIREGGAQSPATDASVSNLFYVSGTLTKFSPYAISNVGAPLPVTLLSFTGKRTGTVNELKWTTASEQNSRGFEVERSLDGRSYASAGFVASRAQGGNSSSDITYTYSESSSAGTQWYYRLKQVDLDGRSKYSAVLLLKADKSAALTLEGVYPNPVREATHVRLAASRQGAAIVLQLTDILGKVVRTQPVLTDAGSSTTVVLNLNGLAAGQYYLRAVAANGELSEAVTLVKQ